MKLGKYIRIMTDFRDANILQSLLPISDEDINMFLPLIESIKNFKEYKGISNSWIRRYNWPRREIRRDLGEQTIEEIYNNIDRNIIEKFDNEYVPKDENYGCHTILSIEIIEISNCMVLFDKYQK